MADASKTTAGDSVTTSASPAPFVAAITQLSDLHTALASGSVKASAFAKKADGTAADFVLRVDFSVPGHARVVLTLGHASVNIVQTVPVAAWHYWIAEMAQFDLTFNAAT